MINDPFRRQYEDDYVEVRPRMTMGSVMESIKNLICGIISVVWVIFLGILAAVF
jgi:hypothetical protein